METIKYSEKISKLIKEYYKICVELRIPFDAQLKKDIPYNIFWYEQGWATAFKEINHIINLSQKKNLPIFYANNDWTSYMFVNYEQDIIKMFEAAIANLHQLVNSQNKEKYRLNQQQKLLQEKLKKINEKLRDI